MITPTRHFLSRSGWGQVVALEDEPDGIAAVACQSSIAEALSHASITSRSNPLE